MSRSKTYKKFTREFKQEAVKLSRQPGNSVRQVAGNLDIPPRTLELWRRKQALQGDAAFSGDVHRTPAELKIRELERRLAEVMTERDILKKAAAWFAKQQL
jgi:transposase